MHGEGGPALVLLARLRGRGSSVTASLTYADWADLLGRHFFHEGRDGQPVTFFVDDELLARLGDFDDPERAAASLASALNSRLAPDSYGRRFNKIDEECTTWKVRGAEGYPPSLPLLATAVLAGTRMARERGIAPNNYWKRFRDLLELQASNDLKGINDVLPGLWKQLTWWLDDHHHGRLGRSTVEEDSWWTIIGFALSQALFRESDRQHLTDLFRKIGLAPAEESSPRELLQYFKAWAPGSPLSLGAKHMAADDRYDERLTAILIDEASRWDGVLRDERGRKLGSLLVAYEPAPRPTYALAAERPVGFPDSAVFSTNSDSHQLTSSVDGWYDETWRLDSSWLTSGLRLESDDFILVYRPSPVVPLARNRVLGCWASVARIEPGEKYVVLVDHSQAQAVEIFLKEHAREEWRKEGGAFAPEGWHLFTDVVIEESLAEIPSGPLAVLAPKLRERPTLKGGLLVDGAVSLYLCGGEPDLWLPSLLDPATVVRVDGAAMDARAGQRISLSVLRLSAGTHEVTVGAATLRFATTREFRDRTPIEAGTLGYVLTARGGSYAAVSAGAVSLGVDRADGEVAVAGAHLIGAKHDLPASQATIVLPLHAQRYRMAGATPGEVIEPREPTRPAWLDSAGHGALYPIGFEVSPGFDPVWIVVERSGRITVRLRSAIPPGDDGGRIASLKINAWCNVFELDPELDANGRELWARYRAVADAQPKLTTAEIVREHETRASNRRLARTRHPAAMGDHPKPELMIEKPIRLRLPLQHRTADRYAYESADTRFQVTYWRKLDDWTVSERLHYKDSETIRLGRFRTEKEALAAVSKAARTIRTMKRKERR